MFYLVYCTLPDGREDVSVIPENWLNDDYTCVWLPYRVNYASANKMASKCKEPESDWSVYPARVIKAFDSYFEANKKLPLATLTSDLSGDEDGKRVPAKRKVYDNSEETRLKKQRNELEYGSTKLTLPKPPDANAMPAGSRIHLKELPIEINYRSLPSTSLSTFNSGKTEIPPIFDLNILSQSSPDLNYLKTNIFTPCIQTNHIRETDFFQPISEGIAEIRTSTTNSVVEIADQNVWTTAILLDSIDNSSQTEDNLFEDSGLLLDLVKDNIALKTQLAEVHKKLDWIIATLGAIPVETKKHRSDIRKPFSNLDSLKEFDSSLTKDSALRNDIVYELWSLGGENSASSVARMMDKLLTNELGCKFSLLGKRGNQSFKALTLCSIMFDALKLHKWAKGTTINELEAGINSWLRHCKSRLSKESKQEALTEDGEGLNEETYSIIIRAFS